MLATLALPTGTAAESDADLSGLYARAVWSDGTEPCDADAGRLTTALGHALALETIQRPDIVGLINIDTLHAHVPTRQNRMRTEPRQNGDVRIVIAPNSFKGSASAMEVAEAIAEGWRGRRPDDELRLMPMADGGEGTVDAFSLAITGSERQQVVVTGPHDRDVQTEWVLLPDGTAVVELASASGITLLNPLAPLTAHSLGFGQAIAAALER